MKVFRNKYGFYELTEKPAPEDLRHYYADKYYQQSLSSYSKEYSAEELKYIRNKIEQKYALIAGQFEGRLPLKLLDVGCGEGYTLSFFKNMGWQVKGLDVSEAGIKQHNPECVSDLVLGDFYENIENIASAGEEFDLIWLDNVLEHALDPLDLLKKCHRSCRPDGLLVIEVPNDFSVTQRKLQEHGLIDAEYWIAVPDHISYFNKGGLINLAARAGWRHVETVADFPIEHNLFNPNANYQKDRAKGKGAHLQRVRIENMLHEISIEQTNELYRILAAMGLGRQIISVLRK